MRSRCRCSRYPAIHTNSRSWLRSSSTHEPSDPPLRVVHHASRYGLANTSIQPKGSMYFSVIGNLTIGVGSQPAACNKVARARVAHLHCWPL